MPKRPLSRLEALVLSGMLLLTLCSCGDEDFSSLASDASGSSAPEWPSQSALGEWDAFSSEAGGEEILSSQFSQELSQQSQEPLPSSSALEPSSAAEPQVPSVSEPSLSDAVSEQTQTQNRQSPPEPIRC